MKKLLIFLTLFSFAFAGYCAVYDFPNGSGGEISVPSSFKITRVYQTNGLGIIVQAVNGASLTNVVNISSNVFWNNKDFCSADIINGSTISVSIYGGSGAFSIEVVPNTPGEAPVIISGVEVSATAGQSFSYITVATGDSTITYGSSGLPAYLTSDGSSISGTLPYSDTNYEFYFTVTATNSSGSDSKTVHANVIVANPPVITSSTTVSATCGEAFSYTTTATGSPTITYGSSGLPAYLVGNGSSISGTIPPSLTDVSFSFTVIATNDYGSDSKLVTVNATAGAGTGHFDSDDDVPAINAMSTAVTTAINSFRTEFGDFHTVWDEWTQGLNVFYNRWDNYFYDIQRVLVDNIQPDISLIKANTDIFRDDTAFIKTQVTEINDKMTNIQDVINTLNTDTSAKMDDIKGVLNSQLSVQQDQLSTQQSILEVLNRLASPEPAETPAMPDDPDDPATPAYAIDFTFNKESNSGDLQSYDKSFPIFDTALRQRSGVLDYTFRVPLSEISSSLDDRYVNFSSGVIGDFVSGIRAILSCILYYFTLMYWFKAVKRITD